MEGGGPLSFLAPKIFFISAPLRWLPAPPQETRSGRDREEGSGERPSTRAGRRAGSVFEIVMLTGGYRSKTTLQLQPPTHRSGSGIGPNRTGASPSFYSFSFLFLSLLFYFFFCHKLQLEVFVYAPSCGSLSIFYFFHSTLFIHFYSCIH